MSPPDEDERQRIAESWGKEATTLKEMNMRHKKHIVRFITAFTRGEFNRPKTYYLMFEWADGGCLEDLWYQNPMPVLTADLVKQAVEQLRGLAEALEATHNRGGGVGVRHGDLKPENILRFWPKPKNIFGTLKIGDWGLAKYHNTATVLRGESTTTKYGTTLYEPPEVELGNVTILGRQYDVWSMGCIILELIIWLLYGYENVTRFREEVKGDSNHPVPCYRIVSGIGTDQYKATVHDTVVRWIDHMAEDPVCAAETAMGELLNLVRKHLLVVELMGAQTHHTEEWDPPVSQGSSMQPPEIAVTRTSSNRVGESDLQRGPSLQATHRTTSKGLIKYLEEQILDDEDRVEDFWLRVGPPGFQRRAPPPLVKISTRDELLKVPKGQTKQVSRDRNPVSEIGRLAIQDKKFVSTHDFASLPSLPATQK
jgi:serine/threonine protein kinase